MASKFLLVEAELWSTGITDATGAHLDKSDLLLPESLWQQLNNWVAAYDSIVGMKDCDIVRSFAAIKGLDQQGLTIASLVRAAYRNEYPVFYKSEGLNSFMHDISQFDRLSQLFREVYLEERVQTYRFAATLVTMFLQRVQKPRKIPDDLWRRIANWKDRYWPVRGLSVSDRLRHQAEIYVLDAEGLELCTEVQSIVGNSMQIVYKSVGMAATIRTVSEFQSLAESLEERAVDILVDFWPS